MVGLKISQFLTMKTEAVCYGPEPKDLPCLGCPELGLRVCVCVCVADH